MILILLFSWIDIRRRTPSLQMPLGIFAAESITLIKTSRNARIEIAALYPTAWEAVKAEY